MIFTVTFQIAPEDGMKRVKGAPGLIAKLAQDLMISRASIYGWQVVPAERVVAVERYSGIPRELLRADLFGTPQKQPSARVRAKPGGVQAKVDTDQPNA